jgi:large conductance mechanosensitive channel
MALIQEFKQFIARGNVVDLAVGVIIGAAFTGIVNSMVDDLINPIISLATNGLDFSNLFINLKDPLNNTYPTIDAAKAAGVATFNYGRFVNAIIKFLIVALSVFALVRFVHKIMEKHAKAPVPAEPVLTTQEKLLTEIRDLLKKQA